MGRHRVSFRPDGKEIVVEEGASILEAGNLAGIHINNLCGGQGVCGKCKVTITKGSIDKSPKAISLLSLKEIQQGYVLACQTPIKDDLEVEIPAEARLEGEQILMAEGPLAYSLPEEIENILRKKRRSRFIVP